MTAPGQSSPPPHIPATPPVHPRRGPGSRLLFGLAGGLVLVLVAVGSFFAFRYLSGADYDSAPTQIAAVDLGDVGTEARLTGLPGPADADGPEVVRVVGARGSVLVAVDEGSSAPQWMAPVPHSGLEAAEAEVRDAPTSETSSSGSGQAEAPAELEGVPPDCSREEKSIVCGDRSISLGDGALSIQPSQRTGNRDETAAADEVLADSASAAVPIEVGEGGALVGPGGHTYADVTMEGTPVRMIGTEDGPWVVSDGRQLVGLSADTVLWTTDLADADARATGLGEKRLRPNWLVADDVLVIGSSEGVRGIDVDTGEQLWTVGTTLDGFTVSGTRLLTLTDGKLGVFDFAKPTGDERVTAQQTLPGDSTAAELPQFPTGDFANAELSVPPGCAEFGLYYDSYYLDESGEEPRDEHTVSFTDGRAHAPGSSSWAGMTMEAFTTTRMPGAGVTAIEFSCNGGGNYIYPSLGLYDQDLNLLDSIELWDHVEGRGEYAHVSGDMPKPYFNDVSVMGGYVSVDVGGIGIYGDEGCTACAKSATADVLYQWDGKAYGHLDTVFHLPAEDVRLPATAEVQRFADAVAAGDDDAAGKWATPRVMRGLEDELGDLMEPNPPTVRSTHFPAGVKVDTCELIKPYGDVDFGSEYWFNNGKTTLGLYSEDSIEPGDIVCGVIDPQAEMPDQYLLYLLLRGHADGSVEVYETGRQFG